MKLKGVIMRNSGLVFFFIVAGLFLQGCDPIPLRSMHIKGKEPLAVYTDNKILEIAKTVELIARQSGFTPVPDYNSIVLLHKRNKDGIVTSLIVYFEHNIIKIDIKELGHLKLSEEAVRLQNQIADALDQSLKDCCIITMYDKYSGRN